MPSFAVEFSPAAARDLRHLGPAIRAQLLRASAVLEHTPYPHPAASHRIRLLVGITPRHFRLRVGDYRIVYRVEGARVIVVRVAHRREAYR